MKILADENQTTSFHQKITIMLDATDAEEFIEHYSQTYEEIRKRLNIRFVSNKYSYWLLRRAIKKTSHMNGFHANGKLISLVSDFMNEMRKIYKSDYGPHETASKKEKEKFLQLAEPFLVNIYKRYFV